MMVRACLCALPCVRRACLVAPQRACLGPPPPLISDAMMVDNVYKYFKAPPFENITMLSQNDGTFGGINCGVMYFQNALPSGPVAWMPANLGAVHAPWPAGQTTTWSCAPHVTRFIGVLACCAVDRTLRVYENYDWFRERFPPDVETWEQLTWDDMLGSTVHGQFMTAIFLSKHYNADPEHVPDYKTLQQKYFLLGRSVRTLSPAPVAPPCCAPSLATRHVIAGALAAGIRTSLPSNFPLTGSR